MRVEDISMVEAEGDGGQGVGRVPWRRGRGAGGRGVPVRGGEHIGFYNPGDISFEGEK